MDTTMKRTNLLLATVGGSAVLAVAGVALGVNAASGSRTGGTALAAATVAPTATDAPEATGSPSAGTHRVRRRAAPVGYAVGG
ncbi:hypothetical protein NKG94_05575 [Micromonospora sp. M12]